MQVFYLGTHQPGWLASAGVELFVSHRRLAQRTACDGPPPGGHWTPAPTPNY